MAGVFITIEGPDGAGKTTLINQLIPVLSEVLKVELLSTREPGGNAIAEKIRALILDPNHIQMDARTEALLYAASRRQHLVDKIIPALNQGKMVLCDRFVDSSIAYQGYARGIGAKQIQDINEFAIDHYYPDLTIYLDIEPEIGLERIYAQRGNEINRLDMENVEFHKAVRQGYLHLVEHNRQRIVLLDGRESVEDLVEQCVRILKEKYSQLFRY
ncbi:MULTISPECIES: dTMP kinase [unclassified Granulicatella]|uniref:dTMP kinase n=1 Tax=unclassified Granulicatella TaxID=2630493 RepID=UPI001073D9B0|nr:MULTISPECIES: dTMP kinase [unclassified Granulicatella]MBF0779975.1 dTMP kinase [Granulicatella sp. 19428wC4_WM01]TFU95991.1 dTMP kinase [Granulicatella sp. WM01]